THSAVWPLHSLTLGSQAYNDTQMMTFLGYGGSNSATHLARQLVATKLNLAVGSEPSILPDVNTADLLLTAFPPGSNPAGADKTQITAVKNRLEAYNTRQCGDDPVIP